MKIGVITYDTQHLKTEQLVLSYAQNTLISNIVVLALPFKQRPVRDIRFQHRPDQTAAISTSELCKLPKVDFRKWDGYEKNEEDVSCFVIAGAGILDIEFATGRPIVNAHPGIIPTTRGLDAFKWAILENDPIGNTLHLIDSEVDKGEVLTIRKTPVFSTDSIQSLARRHYESEIELMKNIPSLLTHRETQTFKEKPAKMRMPKSEEEAMFKNFEHWKSLYAE